MEETLLKIAQTINTYLSDYILIFLLIGVGLYYSIRTKFVQVRCFGEGMKKTFGNLSLSGGKQKSGLSSFQALATAIAAQVGTGNIVGACGAILIGGPGAIFWMWIIAFFGMATIYSEAVLALKTRKIYEDGTVAGGPVYYIRTAFKGKFGKFLANFFSVAALLALGLFGAMVQSNSITGAFENAMGVSNIWSKIIIGAIIAALSGIVFIGGVQRLGSVTEKIVPIMATLYLVGGIIVLIFRAQYIPETFGMIFKYAFQSNAIIGGSIGYAIKTAMSQGAKRGLFSNEAGMGSTPHAHAQANVDDPHDQGVVAMIGVFIDTFCVLTMTALVVISTLFVGDGPLAGGLLPDKIAESGITKATAAQVAFGSVFGDKVGSIFVAICLLFFAFSTILGWNLFGRINARHLFGRKVNLPYSVLAIIFVFIGSLVSNDLVWELTDMFNNLMVIPNVIALFALGGLLVKTVGPHLGKKSNISEKE